MQNVFYIVQMILGVVLISLVVAQSKGSGAGAMFGGDSSFTTTRRGAEKTMFNLTVVVALLFFLTALVSMVVLS
ncbi:MAG: preprotein translocase subunit SecG [Chloroflexota bacterium]|nr:preprotein translocase subunit SecG [Chloroflexota bacterium]